MKDWFNKKYAIIALYAFLTLAATILFAAFLDNVGIFFGFIKSFLGMIDSFIIGFAFAYLLNPSYTFFREKVYGRFIKKQRVKLIKYLSITTVYVITLGLVAFLLYIVIPQFYNGIVDCVNNLVTNYNTYYENINTFFTNITGNETFINDIISDISAAAFNYLKNIQLSDFAAITNFTISITSTIFSICVGVIISIYMLFNKEKFCAQFKKLGFAIFSKKIMYRLQKIFGKGHVAFGQYLTGVLIDALVVGTASSISMAIVGIPYPVLIGVIIGITNMIPFFGPFIGGVPSVLLVLMIDPIKAIWLTIILIVLQQIDGNFFAPKIIGQKIGLSAIWVIFAILVGGGFFGILGMLLAVPVFSILYLFISGLVKQRLEAKGMSPETSDYYATSDVSDKYTNVKEE